MKSSIAIVLTLFFASSVAAQPQELEEETKQHLKWLNKFVGEWKVEHEGGGTGKLTCTMLGDQWLINDMQMSASGFEVRGLQTIGYDANQKMYVGTWVDSMSGFMWQYEGTVDESGNKLILGTKGPDMTDPTKLSRYRDAYEFKSADHIVSTTSVQDDDGEWTVVMTGNAYRVESDN